MATTVCFFFIELKIFVNFTYLYLSEIKKQGLIFSIRLGHFIINVLLTVYNVYKVNDLHPKEVSMQSSCARIFHHSLTSSFQTFSLLKHKPF